MINFLNKLDQDLFLILNGGHVSFLDQPMVFLSGQVIWFPVVLFFLRSGRVTLTKKDFFVFVLFMSITLFLSDVTSSYVVKNIVARVRPCRMAELKPLIHQFGQKCSGRFGFVSSHAANSMALVTFVFHALHLRSKFHFIWIMPLLVGFSRIYLGVHYPGDVLAGLLLGGFWAILMAKLFQKTRAPV